MSDDASLNQEGAAEREEISSVGRVGALAISALQEIGCLVWMIKETGAEVRDRVMLGRSPIRLEQLFYQCDRVGVGSVPMVILLSLFIGLTMAMLTGYQLEIFGIVTLVPGVVSVSFTREMAPLFTGIVLASRVGAAYTAELGAMTAGGEVDAIEGMGIGALRYLVAPRFLAIFLMTPCLSMVSVISGICGAAFISSILLHLSYGYFYDQVVKYLLMKDVMAGGMKSLLFGGIIGVIACYKGLAVHGGAVGVGTATTSSVVTAICAVIACDSVSNILIVTFFP